MADVDRGDREEKPKGVAGYDEVVEVVGGARKSRIDGFLSSSKLNNNNKNDDDDNDDDRNKK